MADKAKNYTVIPLGEILLDLDYLTQAQWEEALASANTRGLDFREVLLTAGTIDVGQLTHALALQNGMRFWDWAHVQRIVERHGLQRAAPLEGGPALAHVACAKEGGPVLILVSDLANASDRARLKAAYATNTQKVEVVAVTPETLRAAALQYPPPEASPQPQRRTPETDVLSQPPTMSSAPEDTLPPVGDTDELQGLYVDDYRIERELASGAAGVVYLATRMEDGAPVALKRLHADLAANERAVKQLGAERQILERFDHPSIIRVFGGGLWEGVPYFAMELMPGVSLADHLREGEPPSVPRVLHLWCQIADALAYAHRMGVLHRDIKPANILLTENGDAKVADFGIAHPTSAGAERAGGAAGTLLYMAPEQLRGRPLTPAADIFALGMLAFEMLTGEIPDANLDLQLLVRRRQQRDTSFDDVRRPLMVAMRERGRLQDVGASLTDFARLLHRCLRKNPRDRFANAEDLAKSLRQLMKLRGWPAPLATPLPPPQPHSWSSDEGTYGDGTMQVNMATADGAETAAASLAGALAAASPTVPEDYEVIKPLGSGSMGEVYLARDRDTGRQVALKMISPEMAANKRFRDRFQREAEVLGRLQHPSIVHIYGVQFEGPTPHIAMEYVDGRDLDVILKERGRLTVEESVPVIVQTADALQHVHSHGVIHRDLKPSNLMLTTAGRIKILDFGVAKDSEGADLTKSGAVIGTPHYMSPEQAAGTAATPLSDMYALGMIWYQLLVGTVPFRGSIPEVLHQHVAIQPPRVRDSVEVHPDVDRLVARMLRKEGGQRPQTFEEVVHIAEAAIAPPSALSEFWHSVAAPAVLFVLGGTALWYGSRAREAAREIELPAEWWATALLWGGGGAIALALVNVVWRMMRRATASAAPD